MEGSYSLLCYSSTTIHMCCPVHKGTNAVYICQPQFTPNRQNMTFLYAGNVNSLCRRWWVVLNGWWSACLTQARSHVGYRIHLMVWPEHLYWKRNNKTGRCAILTAALITGAWSASQPPHQQALPYPPPGSLPKPLLSNRTIAFLFGLLHTTLFQTRFSHTSLKHTNTLPHIWPTSPWQPNLS